MANHDDANYDNVLLFAVGESSGRPSRSIARHIPGTGGLEGVKANSSSAAGELYKARIVSDISFRYRTT